MLLLGALKISLITVCERRTRKGNNDKSDCNETEGFFVVVKQEH